VRAWFSYEFPAWKSTGCGLKRSSKRWDGWTLTIHLTKCLLNHSNIATTMTYIQVDYDHMRSVLHERSVMQGALRRVRREDTSNTPSIQTRSRQLTTGSPPSEVPPRSQEQISKDVGQTSDIELEKILNYVADCINQRHEQISRLAQPPGTLSAINTSMNSMFRKTVTNASGAVACTTKANGGAP